MALRLVAPTPTPNRQQRRSRPRAVGRPAAARVRPRVSVVVPVYNEAGSLPDLLTQISAALAGTDHEIIFVDDGSRDGSFDVLRRLHRDQPGVRVVRLRRNFGKTAAWSAGFRRARGRVIVTLDADLQDDPAEIPNLLASLDEGLDLVTGWRRQRCDPWNKRLASWCFNRLASWSTGVSLHDMNCGLKAFRRPVVRDLDLYGEMHRFLPVLAHGRGYRVGEIPVGHRPRRHGRSKYGAGRVLVGLLDLLKVVFLTRFVTRPLRLFGAAGLGLLALGAVLSLYLAIGVLRGETLSGQPLFWLALLCFAAGLQVVSLGLIGEMVRHASARQVPEYTVAEQLDQR